jgi:hypothetical protein
MPKYGVSGQTTSQTHSIHAFNNAKYIGLFDIDEYINPQKDITNIEYLLDEIIPDRDEYGGVYLNCRIFYNLHSQPEEGYDFMKIYNCTNIIPYTYRKCFVIPKNVTTFSVHRPTIAKKFIANYRNISKMIYFNHYFFLNKATRGKSTNSKIFVDSSIMRHLSFLKEREIDTVDASITDTDGPPTSINDISKNTIITQEL